MKIADVRMKRSMAPPLRVAGLPRWRTEVEKATLPFWRNYALMISAAAFFLSLSTSFISAWTAHRKDIHDQQSELAGAIQRIQDLMFKEVETSARYRGSAIEVAALDLIRGELLSTTQKARQLAIRLDVNTTHAELTTLAAGAIGMGENPTAKTLLQIAYRNARSAAETMQTLGNLGIVEFRLARSAEARTRAEKRFAEALAVDKTEMPDNGRQMATWVELTWADVVAPFDCTAAKTHFLSGVRQLLEIPLNPQAELMRRIAFTRMETGFPFAGTCHPDELPNLTIPGVAGGPPAPAPLPPPSFAPPTEMRVVPPLSVGPPSAKAN
jgi:hypothetical protein